MTLDWLQHPIAAVDARLAEVAAQRQRQLTKPPGSLGKLEALGVRLAALRGELGADLGAVWIVVFAADHGVTDRGISAYPSSVTAAMVRNFASGGAAINVLARQLDASLTVVNLGTREPLPILPGVVDRPLGPGTADFTRTSAMTDTQLADALGAGREALDRAHPPGLFIGGEMGIGNSTAAAAVGCALLNLPGAALAGPGSGLDAVGVAHKAAIIDAGLARHPRRDPLAVLRCLGGFEIAALTGAYLRAGQRGMPVLVDGFISSAAALAAVRLQPALAPWLFYAHQSAEPGHARLLEALQAEPLLTLGLRLGEGSGAALAVPLLRAAVALQAGMATFAEAGIHRPD